MEKAEELLKALGLEIPADDADVKVIVAEYREKITEELKSTIDNSEVIAKAKEEGGIVAEKRIKKALNAKFQLGLTNTQSDSTPFEKIVELGAEKIKGSASEDFEKVNARLIELTNENNRLAEEKETAVKQLDAEWKGKFSKEKVIQQLAKIYASGEYTIPMDEAIEMAEFKAKKRELEFEVTDKEIVPIKGGKRANKHDDTGVETLETFAAWAWNPYEKKSNGTGAPTGFVGDQKKDTELSPEAQERINQMKSRMGQTVAA